MIPGQEQHEASCGHAIHGEQELIGKQLSTQGLQRAGDPLQDAVEHLPAVDGLHLAELTEAHGEDTHLADRLEVAAELVKVHVERAQTGVAIVESALELVEIGPQAMRILVSRVRAHLPPVEKSGRLF